MGEHDVLDRARATLCNTNKNNFQLTYGKELVIANWHQIERKYKYDAWWYKAWYEERKIKGIILDVSLDSWPNLTN